MKPVKKKKTQQLNVHLVTPVCKQVWTNTTFQTLRKVSLFFRLLPLRNPFVAWTSQSGFSLQATGLHSRQHLNATSLLLPDLLLKSLEGKDLLFSSSASASSSAARSPASPCPPDPPFACYHGGSSTLRTISSHVGQGVSGLSNPQLTSLYRITNVKVRKCNMK